jgi:DNA-binding response OmpR family regulator
MDKINKVLIVDDEPVGRQLLEAILYRENFDLHFAEDGNMAYEKALQLKPDLILMDVMMPGMDGFEVCRRLREHEILVNVPIMLITALDDRDSMIKGLDAGADDYIAKPFDRIEVLAKIKNITQFDRYKRIVHDKGNKEVKEKTPVNKELSLYYTSLIQKSLLPSNEYISKLLPQ